MRFLSAIAVGAILAAMTLPCAAQSSSTGTGTSLGGSTGGSTTGATGLSGVTGTTTTTSTGSGSLVPGQTGTQIFTNFKNLMLARQSGASSANATATTVADPVRDDFLIPFIENFFTSLTNLITQLAAASVTGNAVPTTSAPA